MGINLTVPQLLNKLGVPTQSHNAFKIDVLNYIKLESKWGGSITAAKDLAQVTQMYLQTDKCAKFRTQPVTDQLFPPHEGLLQAVDLWVNEERQRESQDDPSYSGSPSGSPGRAKKRKRLPDSFTHPKTHVGKPVKRPHVGDEPVNNTPRRTIPSMFGSPQMDRSRQVNTGRSPTVESGLGTLQDIPYKAPSIEDQFEAIPLNTNYNVYRAREDIFDISNDSPEPSDFSRLAKGKTAVRNPPMSIFTTAAAATPNVVSLQTPNSLRDTPDLSPELRSRQLVDTQSEAPTRSSEPTRQATRPPRASMNRIEMEEAEPADSSQSAEISRLIDDMHSPSSQTHPVASSRPITPPQTSRQPRFSDPISTAHITSHNAPSTRPSIPIVTNTSQPEPHNKPSETRETRLLHLLTGITAYIQECKHHSLSVAKTDNSSSRETEKTHRIRAAAFSHLHDDVTSRIDAFLDEERGIVEEGKVTSFCLWSWS